VDFAAFEKFKEQVAAGLEPEEQASFAESGLAEIDGLEIRVSYSAAAEVAQLLVDLGPLPEDADDDLVGALLESNYEGFADEDGRPEFALQPQSGHVIARVLFSPGDAGADQPDELLYELVEDAAMTLELVLAAQGAAEDGDDEEEHARAARSLDPALIA
jgi:hypothetical protein